MLDMAIERSAKRLVSKVAVIRSISSSLHSDFWVWSDGPYTNFQGSTKVKTQSLWILIRPQNNKVEECWELRPR